MLNLVMGPQGPVQFVEPGDGAGVHIQNFSCLQELLRGEGCPGQYELLRLDGLARCALVALEECR